MCGWDYIVSSLFCVVLLVYFQDPDGMVAISSVMNFVGYEYHKPKPLVDEDEEESLNEQGDDDSDSEDGAGSESGPDSQSQ